VIVYLDASALVKRYVAESGSAEVEALIGEAQAVGTAVLSRAEPRWPPQTPPIMRTRYG
jgi:predicted nucleic acid-binding protein